MTRALITGITGQDGRYLAKLLNQKGYDVFGLVRSTTLANQPIAKELPGSVTLLRGDFSDAASIGRAIETSEPDEIYNLAAVSSLDEANADPALCFDINARAPKRMLALIGELGASKEIRFCQATSRLIFGPPDGSVRNELTPLNPRDPYAVAKAEAHKAVMRARDEGLFATSMILFNHESPLRSTRFVTRRVSKGVAKIAVGEETKLKLKNLGAVRDWGFAGDFVEAMWLSLQKTLPDDYLVATGRHHSVRDLAEAAFHCVGINDWQRYVETEGPQTDETWSPADPSKVKRELAWNPRVDFEALVSMMVEYDLRRI